MVFYFVLFAGVRTLWLLARSKYTVHAVEHTLPLRRRHPAHPEHLFPALSSVLAVVNGAVVPGSRLRICDQLSSCPLRAYEEVNIAGSYGSIFKF